MPKLFRMGTLTVSFLQLRIRLFGVMHYAFAASILYNNPAKLVDLTLDNLQQAGKGCDHFLYRCANQRQDYLQSPSIWNQMIQHYGAGPMQNLLGHLACRCPNLRPLTFRKVGQARHTESNPEFAAKDEDIYIEVAWFRYGVRRTLRHVVFEQGGRMAPRPIPAAGHIFVVGPPRPMDTRFVTLVHRHLVRPLWLNLESVTIGGAYVVWNSGNGTIQMSRRVNIQAVTRRDVEMMDHIGLGDPLVGMIR